MSDKQNKVDPGAKWIFRFFGLVTIIFGLLIIAASWSSVQAKLHPTSASRLETLWNEDTTILLAQQQLPKAWGSLASFDLVAVSPQAEEWKTQIHPSIPVSPTGKYRLEVLLDSWEDPETKTSGAMVQYHLVELASGNTVWERGRTYVLEGQGASH